MAVKLSAQRKAGAISKALTKKHGKPIKISPAAFLKAKPGKPNGQHAPAATQMLMLNKPIFQAPERPLTDQRVMAKVPDAVRRIVREAIDKELTLLEAQTDSLESNLKEANRKLDELLAMWK
jgi:hypothetical protein